MTGGSSTRLPTPLLTVAGASTLFAVLVSTMSILLQLRNYRKPALQRMVVRIMIMVPLYAISSLISLFSVEAAFFIDAVRDVYEAFVIYCFFVLLTTYLGGERSLLILLHGRPPKEPVFPVNLVKREMDVSDPHTFLFLKRGILQYVQVKPVLAFVTMALKAVGKFDEGDFRSDSGYLYVSVAYNVSICLALYCLAMFWVVVSDDLKPFRPVPKFLCVKGILFFSFWQSVAISALVAANVVTRLGPYTNPAKVSVGLNDLLICIEMPLFAVAHNYAFSYRDFVDVDDDDDKHASSSLSFVARMPMYYAFRDAFGAKDVVEDCKATLRGRGMDYREFEPAEGRMHQGVGLENRIRAGLRYTKGGKKKYWLPKGVVGATSSSSAAGAVLADATDGRREDEEGLLWDATEGEEEDDDDDAAAAAGGGGGGGGGGYELPFGDVDEADEALFDECKKSLFGDYHYPTIDVSSEGARLAIWTEEERVLRDERGAWFSPVRGSKGVEALMKRRRDEPRFEWTGYGAVGRSEPTSRPDKDDDDDDDKNGVRAGDERIIDHEDHRVAVAAARPSDVVMRWTKMQRSDSDSRGGGAALLQRQQRQQEQERESERARSSPPELMSGRSTSSHQARAPNANATTTLPPDAVDLVVAVEDEPDGRRRGRNGDSGPGAVADLKKLKKNSNYRRREEEDGKDGGGGEGVIGDEDDDQGALQERRRVAPTATTATTTTTPLRRPHLQEYRYDDVPHDYNPWA